MRIKNLMSLAIVAGLSLGLSACSFKGIKDKITSIGKPGKAKWSYEGEAGPEKWGELKKSYHLCQAGKQQSPVNIAKTNRDKLAALKFDYKDAPLTVINNGHSLQVNYPAGSTLTVGDATYELLQFHFHTPSEHTRRGKTRPMEVHFVHKNDKGQIAVVGIFMRLGKSNALFDTILKNAPEAQGKNKVKDATINAAKLHSNVMSSYFSYTGSLTTPPCSENVRWIVLKNSVRVSKAQVEAFKQLFHANARPVQPLNDRKITETK